MTIRHIAWLRFNSEVTNEQIDNHLQACRRLNDDVPAVIDPVCGPNLTDRSGGFTHGIVVTVADHDDLERYLAHPVHVPVAQALLADVADIRVMDLET